jgi:hypothetical protein
MQGPSQPRLFLAALVLGFMAALPSIGAEAPLPKVVDFNRDVRPILSENCYQCHGPDKNKRKAGLELQKKEGLFRSHDETRTVVPGKPAESELFRRLVTEDKNERMPSPKSGKSLSPRQIAVIRTWIEQGAAWKGHWAYLASTRPQPPAVEQPGSVRNPVDRFILARLQEAGLQPSPEADRVTLIRRLAFDLVGLPPTRAEVDAFVADRSPDAYEKLVERLLASPHHGERLAMAWLDLVRYADSIGYHSDNPMQVWPYRDYVIRAFTANKRFDQFTVEQLAGDLLPDAASEQKVASGYNRLLQTTEEGGAQAKEYLAKYAADRVRNAASVWLGATMGCCECHDHKFDPYSTRDFYRFAAFFADLQEPAVGGRGPGTPVPSPEQAAGLKKLDETLAALRSRLDTTTPQLAAAQAEWEKRLGSAAEWKVLAPEGLTAVGGTKLTSEPDGIVKAGGTIPATETMTVKARTSLAGITAFRLEVLDDPALPAHGPGAAPNGNFVLTEFRVSAANAGQAGRPIKWKRASADHAQDGFPVASAIDGKKDTGWAILPQAGKPHTAVFEPAEPVGTGGDTELTFTLEFQSVHAQHLIGKFRLAVTKASDPASISILKPAVQAALAFSGD